MHMRAEELHSCAIAGWFFAEKNGFGFHGSVQMTATQQQPYSIGALEFSIYHSDNASYETEWNGLRLNDDYHRLYFIRSGEAEVVYNDIPLTMRAGHTYLFPTTRSFRYSCPESFHLLNVCFKMTLQGGLDILSLHPWRLDVEVVDHAATLKAMEEINDLILDRQLATQIALRSLIMQLVSPHFDTPETERDRLHRRAVQRLAPVLRHIGQNVTGTIRISQLAQLAGMSRSHFSRRFTETFGLSPQEYVRKQRIERVKLELHHSHLPLAVIAEDFGFSSASHLTREFKQHTGYTPNQFRHLENHFA